MQTETQLKTTPLFKEHLALGAKMGPFAGWNMPIQYAGIIAETLHTRKYASVFDICHMGEFLIKGDAKKSGLESLVTSRLDNLDIGSCRYSSMLDERGGIIDDLIIYRKAPQEWMVVVNAATIAKDKLNFTKYLSRDSCLCDLSEKLGKIDLQGPLAREVLKDIAPAAAGLKYYSFVQTDILGEKNIVSRTGYTGELGFEIYAPLDKIKSLWKTLLADPRVKPAGLGSRDCLRQEMGYSLYGQDIDENFTPLEAGLEKYVDFNKEFRGRPALLEQKRQGLKQTRCFVETSSRRSPRHLHKIFSEQEKQIGFVTSGSFSPHLECGIGMGFINFNNAAKGSRIFIGDEKLKIEAVLTDKPFLKKTSLRT